MGDYSTVEKDLSDRLKQKLNDDVTSILQKCLNHALEILSREKELLEKMAESLIEKITLEYDEVTEICQKYGVGKIRRIEEKGLLQEFKKLIQESNPQELSVSNGEENIKNDSTKNPEEEPSS